MRNFIGNKHKTSVPAPVKKRSLIEIAMEEDPFLGIWMGPPEKLPNPLIQVEKNPRSKSFEVPSAKQLEMLNQGKVSRGMLWIYFGYVKGMFRVCFGLFLGKFLVCFGHFLCIFWVCCEHVLVCFGHFLGMLWARHQ